MHCRYSPGFPALQSLTLVGVSIPLSWLASLGTLEHLSLERCTVCQQPEPPETTLFVEGHLSRLQTLILTHTCFEAVGTKVEFDLPQLRLLDVRRLKVQTRGDRKRYPLRAGFVTGPRWRDGRAPQDLRVLRLFSMWPMDWPFLQAALDNGRWGLPLFLANTCASLWPAHIHLCLNRVLSPAIGKPHYPATIC